MPKIIDHSERRNEFAEAVCELVVKEGAANVTIRQIAAQAGYSTGVLAHYFPDKESLMKFALVYAHRQVDNYLNIDELTGLDGLMSFIRACLPLDDRRLFLARVEAGFFGFAVGDKSYSQLVVSEYESFDKKIHSIISSAVDFGDLKDDVDISDLALNIRMLVDGISFRVAVGSFISRDAQLSMLDNMLDPFLAD